jgi:hypothetical protein
MKMRKGWHWMAVAATNLALGRILKDTQLTMAYMTFGFEFLNHRKQIVCAGRQGMSEIIISGSHCL